MWANKDIRAASPAAAPQHRLHKCVFDDIVNEVFPKLAEAEALLSLAHRCTLVPPQKERFLYGPPVLQYPEHRQDHESGCFGRDLSARRQHASYDVLNKILPCGMPVASSQYWNMVYGGSAEEVKKDAEGLRDHAHPWPQHGPFDERVSR